MASAPPRPAAGPAATAHGSSAAHVRVFARTDVGRTREHNEDAYLVADLTEAEPMTFEAPGAAPRDFVAAEAALFLVADGLGGAAAGEVASHLATRAALEAFRAALPGAAGDPRHFATALRDAVLAANASIHRTAAERPDLRGMGTTMTAAALLGPALYLAQVGDSRAYLVRDGGAHQLTKDQSLVQRLVDAGELTPEQAETSARRNIILQALGADATVKVDVTRQALRQGDVLLLCSDGLSGQVRAAEIAAYAAASTDVDGLCRALVDRANETGGPDNITAVAARFGGDALPASGEGPDDDVGRHTFDVPPAPGSQETPIAARAPAPILTGIRGGSADPGPALAADVELRPAGATPGDLAPGVSAGELEERRGRVRLVYLALAVLAASVAAFYLWQLLGG